VHLRAVVPRWGRYRRSVPKPDTTFAIRQWSPRLLVTSRDSAASMLEHELLERVATHAPAFGARHNHIFEVVNEIAERDGDGAGLVRHFEPKSMFERARSPQGRRAFCCTGSGHTDRFPSGGIG